MVGETLERCLIRELTEEAGIEASCRSVLWSEECFWQWNGKQAHNITFYFLVEPEENSPLPEETGSAEHRDNPGVVLEWLPLEELANVTVYPEFIKSEIFRTDEPMKHFVSAG